jgi:hypothetical protein
MNFFADECVTVWRPPKRQVCWAKTIQCSWLTL